MAFGLLLGVRTVDCSRQMAISTRAAQPVPGPPPGWPSASRYGNRGGSRCRRTGSRALPRGSVPGQPRGRSSNGARLGFPPPGSAAFHGHTVARRTPCTGCLASAAALGARIRSSLRLCTMFPLPPVLSLRLPLQAVSYLANPSLRGRHRKVLHLLRRFLLRQVQPSADSLRSSRNLYL